MMVWLSWQYVEILQKAQADACAKRGVIPDHQRPFCMYTSEIFCYKAPYWRKFPLVPYQKSSFSKFSFFD